MLQGFGALTQKTASRWSCPNPYISKPSPCLADVGLFVRHPTQQSPLEQRVSLQAYAPSRSQLFTARRVDMPYVKHNLQLITPLQRVCRPIFLTPRPRRSYAPSKSLLFTVLESNTSYMKHLEHGYLSRELSFIDPSLTGAQHITHTHD